MMTKHPILTVVLLGLWLGAGAAAGAEEATPAAKLRERARLNPPGGGAEKLLARVGGEPISVATLREYARLNPIFYSQLQVPGGPTKVLNNLINERLLVLAGERRGIPRPPEDPANVAYAYEVRKALMQPCPPPSEAGIKAFYDTHPGRFSTPLYLRLWRLVLAAGDDPQATSAKLRELRAQIEAGGLDKAALADQMSLDPLGRGRGGDLGFNPVDGVDPLVTELAKLPKGGVYGPVVQGPTVAIFQVTDRREPIPEPFESARKRVAEEQLRQCKEEAFTRLIGELKAEWPVEVYVDDIGIVPQPPPEAGGNARP